MNSWKSVLGAWLCAALLASGCAQMGDIFGGSPPNNPPSPTSTSSVRGTVQTVDTQSHTVTVAADSGSQSNLRNTDRMVLTYDGSTVVTYQGRQYGPQDLESGDRIAANVERVGERMLARNIDVISTISDNRGGNAANLRDFDATIRNVNTGIRTIELAPRTGQSAPVVVGYDSGTRVDFQGDSYRPEDLERGDEVRVTTRGSANGLVADRIIVTRSMSGATAHGQAQVRGTVRQIDTRNRTIELGNASWAQGFNPAPGGNSTLVDYDAGTTVEYQGKRYGMANLEPGDVVDIDVSTQGGPRPLARRITVARTS
jgi:hypothetical protein